MTDKPHEEPSQPAGAPSGPPPDTPPGAAPGAVPPPPPGYQTPYGPPGPHPGPAAPTAVTSDDRTFGMLSHLLGIFTWFIGPLVVYLTKGKESPFVQHQAREALNFQITLTIGYLVSAVLMFVIIGILTYFAVFIGGLVLMVLACLAANRGEPYRYPVNIRMVK